MKRTPFLAGCSPCSSVRHMLSPASSSASVYLNRCLVHGSYSYSAVESSAEENTNAISTQEHIQVVVPLDGTGHSPTSSFEDELESIWYSVQILLSVNRTPMKHIPF